MANRSVMRVYKHDILDAQDAAEVIPDPKILANFILRIKRYGDIFNGKTEDEVKTLLQRHNNYAPDAVLEVILELEENGQEFNPPDFYDDGKTKNEGTDFRMARSRKNGYQQKKFYVPGDEAFRSEVLIED